MANKKALFSAVFLFLSGAALGAVCFHVFGRYLLFRSFPPMPPSPKQAMIEHLDRELHLTADQKQRLTPIVEETSRKLEALRVENLPKMETIIDEAAKEASEILTPKQQQRLEHLKAKAKEHLHRQPADQFGPHPPPPPPPGDHFGRPPGGDRHGPPPDHFGPPPE